MRVRVLHLDEAIKDFSRVIGFDPDNSESFVGRGSARLINGDYEAAIKDFDAAVAQAPVDSTAYLIRGIAKIHLHNGDDAAKDFEKSIKLSGKSPVLLQLQVLEIESRINEVRRQKLLQNPLIAD